MNDLTTTTRTAFMALYESKGIDAVDAKIKSMLSACENGSAAVRDRSTIKGELSEVALECHLRYWMERLSYILTVKGLCIKSIDSRATAEIDVMMATPCRIYLFECKSFKGKKVLSKECYLKGGSSEKDVYDQSKYHLQILEPHIGQFRYPSSSKVSPYQLILFELSTDDIDDRREDKWKKNIPLLTLDTIDEWLLTELGKRTEVRWDLAGLTRKLKELNVNSESMFKFHMSKIMNRKKG